MMFAYEKNYEGVSDVFRHTHALFHRKEKKMSKLLDYTVFTDGGCARNPGGRGGYGIVIIDNKVQPRGIRELSGGFESTTNNRMEMMAVCVALEALPDGASLKVITDSRYFLNCFKGAWSRTKNTDLWNRIDAAAKGKTIQAYWVKGHNGNEHNERCDALATQAMRQESLQVDEGYIRSLAEAAAPAPQAKATWQKANANAAMHVDIRVPQKFSVSIERIPASAYAPKHSVSESCAASIISFSTETWLSFRSYMSLKTGGQDAWSRCTKDAIAKRVPNADEAYAVCVDNLGNDKDAMTALRWFARGLPLIHCIRKVLVDVELSKSVSYA